MTARIADGEPAGIPGLPVKARSVGGGGALASRTRWQPAGGVFGRTYLLLRWSMPVLLGWLAIAIAGAWINSGLRLPMTSISAYYYTDAETVFVGVLIGLGVLLIVIQGRTPWEDALMNTAGALAPFVALLPTPVAESDKCIASYCTAKFLNDQIPDNHDIIAFNVWSVAPVWLVLCIYLSLRAYTLRRQSKYEKYSSTFSAVAVIVLGGIALGLWVSETRRQMFYDSAHLTSAGIMVALLILSMVPFALWMGRSERGFFRNMPKLLNNGFWWLFWSVLGLIVLWIGLYSTIPRWDHAVLVIEVFAIAPFAIYWIMQGLALTAIDRNDPSGEPEIEAPHAPVPEAQTS